MELSTYLLRTSIGTEIRRTGDKSSRWGPHPKQRAKAYISSTIAESSRHWFRLTGVCFGQINHVVDVNLGFEPQHAIGSTPNSSLEQSHHTRG